MAEGVFGNSIRAVMGEEDGGIMLYTVIRRPKVERYAWSEVQYAGNVRKSYWVNSRPTL